MVTLHIKTKDSIRCVLMACAIYQNGKFKNSSVHVRCKDTHHFTELRISLNLSLMQSSSFKHSRLYGNAFCTAIEPLCI